MSRQLPDVLDASMTSRRIPSDRHVPQEYTPTSDTAPSRTDWSDLGRRVLAEAWRRLTEEPQARRRKRANPVVLARPRVEGGT